MHNGVPKVSSKNGDYIVINITSNLKTNIKGGDSCSAYC
jgi:hypothetical protein